MAQAAHADSSLAPGALPSGPVEFTMGWWSPGDPEEPPCAACGQKTEFRIEFDRAG